MRTFGLVFAAVLTASFSARAAEPAAQIVFIHPEHYTDASLYGDSGEKPRAVVLHALQEHLNALAARTLVPNETLKLDILDVDIAGRYEWWVRPTGLRVLDDATWPSIKLSYVLEQNGAVVRQGDETVSDFDYLTRTEIISSDPLWREKAMLTEWFAKRFGPPRVSGN